MAASKYRSTPIEQPGMPSGIPYIIGNELAERFSFYGMRAILTVFMTKYLLDSSGATAHLPEAEAKAIYHTFVGSAYALGVFGALISDGLLGKYRTIIALSLVYCLGHVLMSFVEPQFSLGFDPKNMMIAGLFLIAVGSGGIKPCVSAHVGDQFGHMNKHLFPKIYEWFYFSINVGAATSSLATPLLLDRYGPTVAFAVPGFLMFLATIVFWMGRNKFIHVPRGGLGFIREATSGEGLKAFCNVAMILVFTAPFWALFDQSGSALVLQAEKMNRNLFGIQVLSSQIQAANPFLILVFIPLCSYVIYPAIDKFFKLTPLRKMGLGLFLMASSFIIPTWCETRITAGESPTFLWQVLAYVILTLSEVMVSITALEFSYTQAPKTMKSLVVSLYLLGVSGGNFFAAAVNKFIQNPDGSVKLEGASYYAFFMIVMFVCAVIFIPVAMLYRGKTYIQGDDENVKKMEKAEAEGRS